MLAFHEFIKQFLSINIPDFSMVRRAQSEITNPVVLPKTLTILVHNFLEFSRRHCGINPPKVFGRMIIGVAVVPLLDFRVAADFLAARALIITIRWRLHDRWAYGW